MPVKSRKKAARTIKRLTATSESSSEEIFVNSSPSVYFHDPASEHVVNLGYLLLLACWIIFVGGVGGLLGIWDRVLGFEDGTIGDLACYLSLTIVTGFIWTVLNWCESRSSMSKANHVGSASSLFG